jgi:hypothetical protein
MRTTARTACVIAVLALTVSLTGCKREGEDKGTPQANEAATQAGETATQVEETTTQAKEGATQLGEPTALTVSPEQQAPEEVKETKPQVLVLTNEAVGFRLDGMEAQFVGQGEEESSSSGWTVPEPVSPTPRFSFELLGPKALGDFKTISLKFYPKWQGEYRQPAAPVIVSADPDNPAIQMSQQATYDLGALGENFKVLDARGTESPHFMLRPGFGYKMEVVFENEQIHMAEIVFKTKAPEPAEDTEKTE